jgi:acyl carrier protein
MPLTPNGKIDRAALPMVDLDRGVRYEAPQTPVQDVVASIWAKVLGVERVGIDDNFFELGGHSLLATKAMTRVREAFQVEMPLRELFEAPSVRKMGERVESTRRTGQGLEIPEIVQAERNEALPLSYAQQRLWFCTSCSPIAGCTTFMPAIGCSLHRESLDWGLRGSFVVTTLRTYC